MNIYEALTSISNRGFVARPKWGHRCYLFMDGDIIMYSSNGFDSPWQAPHPDLLAEDWEDIIPHP
jgi:hypothetical protein